MQPVPARAWVEQVKIQLSRPAVVEGTAAEAELVAEEDWAKTADATARTTNKFFIIFASFRENKTYLCEISLQKATAVVVV